MSNERTTGENLAARILRSNPSFGSVGYLATNPRGISARELLARMHSPNAPGPGPAQRAS